jgi:peptidoglycan/xylan/chitin deacetylase (PgdA/CDA1 family)
MTDRTRPIPILLYHSISDAPSERFRRWTVRPEQFAAQVAHLQASGRTPLTVAQLAAAIAHGGAELPPRSVVLTFDDGFADFHDRALPVLQEYRFTATLYVATAFVEGTSGWLHGAGEGERPMLTWAQLRHLHASGIECGAHGHSHRPLDVLPRRVAMDEIARSTGLVADAIGAPVVTFAYPHGYYDRAVREMVQAAGHLAACGVKHAMSALDDDRFALARVIVEADTDLARFSRLLEGERLPVMPSERLRTKGWRLLRRAAARLGGGPGALARRWSEPTHVPGWGG